MSLEVMYRDIGYLRLWQSPVATISVEAGVMTLHTEYGDRNLGVGLLVFE